MSIADPFIMDVVSGLVEERKTSMGLSTSTGIVSLDLALGGKLPSGAIEIFGESSAGKTTLLFETIAAAQKAGYLVALCPAEYLDIAYMKVFGIDLNMLILITGNSGEDVLSGGRLFLEDHKKRKCILAVDSATSLRPSNDVPGQWMSMINAFLTNALLELGTESAIILVNQIRTKRSVHPTHFFADGTESSARKVIDQFSARLELSRTVITEKEYTMLVNIMASTFSIPASMLSLPVVKGQGVDTMLDLLNCALERGLVEQSGAWYVIRGKVSASTLGSGRVAAVETLQRFPELAEYLLSRITAGR